MKHTHNSFTLTLLFLFIGALMFTACQEETIAPVPKSFSFLNFDNEYGLNLLGSAHTVVDTNKTVLRLTRDYPSQTGAFWYGRSKMQVAQGFETTFTFRLTYTGFVGADGFAFVVQNISQDSLGTAGSGMGYDGLKNSLAVEFDTYWNDGAGDKNDNHISIHTKGKEPNSVSEAASIGSTRTSLMIDLNDEDQHTVRLTYEPGTLTVYLDNLQVLTAPVYLEEMLELSEGAAYVGFTAATGAEYQNHDILSWSFTPN